MVRESATSVTLLKRNGSIIAALCAVYQTLNCNREHPIIVFTHCKVTYVKQFHGQLTCDKEFTHGDLITQAGLF